MTEIMFGKCHFLKNSISFVLVCDLAPNNFLEAYIGQNIFVFKVRFVGTLNLCLKMPDTEQKTKTQSDHPGLRKRQKTDDKH